MIEPKNKFAKFAMDSCGPVVINDETGLVCEEWRTNLRAAYLGVQRFIDAKHRRNTYEKALQ